MHFAREANKFMNAWEGVKMTFDEWLEAYYSGTRIDDVIAGGKIEKIESQYVKPRSYKAEWKDNGF